MNTVERIPEDFNIWFGEIKRLKKVKEPTKKQKKQIMEYYGDYKYYMGKLFAYLYVLEELGESKYIEKYSKWQNIKWFPKMNKADKKGTWKIKKSLSDHL